mgnify:FL=1
MPSERTPIGSDQIKLLFYLDADRAEVQQQEPVEMPSLEAGNNGGQSPRDQRLTKAKESIGNQVGT